MPPRSNTVPSEKQSRRQTTTRKDGRQIPGRSTSKTTITSPAEAVKPRHQFTIPQIPTRHYGPYSQRLNSPSPRPGMGGRQDSVQTRYISMLLGLDNIPRLHNIFASFSTWILLAGFIIFPGTYTHIASLSTNSNDTTGEAASLIIHSVKHVSLLIIACVCSSIGALGMIYLWHLHAKNYVWILQRIFLPGCINSLTGFISTLIGVYGQQNGVWSITARVTGSVIGGCMVVTGALFVVYNFWFLRNVKKMHAREMGMLNVREGGWAEKLKHKANEPAFGGVV